MINLVRVSFRDRASPWSTFLGYGPQPPTRRDFEMTPRGKIIHAADALQKTFELVIDPILKQEVDEEIEELLKEKVTGNKKNQRGRLFPQLHLLLR